MPSIRAAPVVSLRPDALKIRRHDPYGYDVLSSTRAGLAVPLTASAKKCHDDSASDMWCAQSLNSTQESTDSGIHSTTPSSNASTTHEIRPVSVADLPASAFLPPESLPYHGLPTPNASMRTPSFSVMSAPTPCHSATVPRVKVAIVGFKFGTRPFRATFRVAAGDAVVVEWDQGTTHLGFVQDVVEPDFHDVLPQQALLRRARDGDMRMYETARLRETAALFEAQRIVDKARQNGDVTGAVSIKDIEWQLDSRGVTVVVAFGPNAPIGRNTDAITEILGDRFACDVHIVHA